MVIGEAPGREEDIQGLPFVGRSGKLLGRLLLEEMGITRKDYYIANIIKCRPPENRNPLPDEVAVCRQFIEGQISLIQPKAILTLGNFASQAVLESKEGITKLREHVFDKVIGNVSLKVVPTYHPSYVLRAGGMAMAEMRADIVRAKKLLGQ
jgi:DNA polymerase